MFGLLIILMGRTLFSIIIYFLNQAQFVDFDRNVYIIIVCISRPVSDLFRIKRLTAMSRKPTASYDSIAFTRFNSLMT